MCVMSMVMDWKYDDWQQRYWSTEPIPDTAAPTPAPIVVVPAMPTQQELDEFRRLLERAREYDKQHNQPDCELEEKRLKLRKLAEELGVEINFV